MFSIPLLRREFLKRTAATIATSPVLSSIARAQGSRSKNGFVAQQQRRRRQLWSLLGDLPFNHRPGPAKLIKTEKGPGYTLEYLELDLNGIEPGPALRLIPHKLRAHASGLLCIHWHGGTYPTGKDELLPGRKVLPAYAPVVAEKGIVTLAIDSWCFGERMHDKDGRNGEWDAFKKMIWHGQVLFGMMIFDEHRAVDYVEM